MAPNKDEDPERDQADDAEREDHEEEPETDGDAADEPSGGSGDGSADDGDDSTGGAGGGSEDISDVTAPSVGPHTTFEKDDPEERLARHEQSNTDAMGLDKRREVIGGSYGPTFTRQLVTYGVFILVVGVIVAGVLIAVSKLDQPEKKYPDEAPWSQASATQKTPPPIDFPNYGHPGPGEQEQATPGETQGAPSSENAQDVETP